MSVQLANTRVIGSSTVEILQEASNVTAWKVSTSPRKTVWTSMSVRMKPSHVQKTQFARIAKGVINVSVTQDMREKAAQILTSA